MLIRYIWICNLEYFIWNHLLGYFSKKEKFSHFSSYISEWPDWFVVNTIQILEFQIRQIWLLLVCNIPSYIIGNTNEPLHVLTSFSNNLFSGLSISHTLFLFLSHPSLYFNVCTKKYNLLHVFFIISKHILYVHTSIYIKVYIS